MVSGITSVEMMTIDWNQPGDRMIVAPLSLGRLRIKHRWLTNGSPATAVYGIPAFPRCQALNDPAVDHDLPCRDRNQGHPGLQAPKIAGGWQDNGTGAQFPPMR